MPRRVSLIDIFDGWSQLIAYLQMWHTGRPAAEQCEGCTFSTTHINELSYLRGVAYGDGGKPRNTPSGSAALANSTKSMLPSDKLFSTAHTRAGTTRNQRPG